MSLHSQSHTISTIELESFPPNNNSTYPNNHTPDNIPLASLAPSLSHPNPNPLPTLSTSSSKTAKARTVIIISCVAVVTGLTSFLSGVLVVATPAIARDLRLSVGMVLWPVTIQALTCGCTLLLAGSIADVVGSRYTYFLGNFFQTLTSLACGLSKTGIQLIVFRAFAGIAASMCLTSAVSIINDAFVPGRGRNLAFAAMGGGQPVGFGLGLTLGGVLTSSIGWEWGFHVSAIINGLVFALSMWHLPEGVGKMESVTWKRLGEEIDWAGALIISAALAMLSYVLAVVSTDSSSIQEPGNIALLTVALALLVAFVSWMHRQEKLRKATLIPNSLWKDKVFTSICINVFLVWGAFNAVEAFGNFFLQNIQGLNALQAGLRFLPSIVTGVLANVLVGLLVHRIRADWIVILSLVLSWSSPLLMALIKPKATYWAFAFPAILLNPIGADGLFTVSNLLITSRFPMKTQGLAGGVFQTTSQIGKSVGLALTTVVANDITAGSSSRGKEASPALMQGYRAGFWFLVAINSTSLCMSVWGLRRIGTVGRKQD
ncbi:MAG: hypothetical protein Q9213_004301 [Squamulea squamosa]